MRGKILLFLFFKQSMYIVKTSFITELLIDFQQNTQTYHGRYGYGYHGRII